MPVNLIIGSPASGKTKACIQKIKQIKSNQPFSEIWVLVPDSQNIRYFRRRLAKTGGGIGVNIGTFSAFYSDILARHQIYLPVITPALEHRLVKETVDSVYGRGSLNHYAAIKDKPGFILALQDIFSELRAAYVSPNRFTDYTQGSAPAKRELAFLYSNFIHRLEELNWVDRDGQIWQAIEIMEKAPNTLSDTRLVIVDGFSAFAGARVQFLKLLSQQIEELIIALPGQLDSNRPVHRKAKAQIEMLTRELSPQITHITSTPYLFPESRQLEKYVLEPGEYPKQKSPSPLFLEAPSQAEEAREALRWIKALIKRQGISLHSCAIFAADLQTYRPLLQVASNEFGIKVHFSHPQSLMDSPAIQAVQNLLELPLENFQTRKLLNILRSPYFNFGLDDPDFEGLEAISQHARIVMGREQWDDAWSLLEKIDSSDIETSREERKFKDSLAGININALRDRFSHFWELFKDIEIERSQKDWIIWLESILDGLSFYDQIEGESDQEACTSFADALKALIQSEEVTGTRKFDYSTFLSDLQGTLHGARLDELRTAHWNSLWVGKITEARASRFKAVALLGFSEGGFPAIENPDPFLDEKLRKDLGLEPRLEREQASTFYQAFTRADTHLLITRPYLSEDGEKWEPSTYWDSATQCFETNTLKRVTQNILLQQYDAASPQEVLFWAVKQNHMVFQTDPYLVARWEHLKQSRLILNSRRSKAAQGPYEGSAERITENLAEKYPSNRPWSASRLETYGTCPYQFYVQNVLGLEAKEPPELGLNAQQIGSILHRILELVYQEAPPDADVDQLFTLLDGICEQVFQDAPREFGFRPSSLWIVEQKQFKQMLQETIQALEKEGGWWTPVAFEQKFGIGHTPSLVLDIGADSIFLHGFIDRVDQHTSGGLRVIDYKTGGSHLATRDFTEGRRLQLPIYALAAQDALEMGEVIEAFYWIIRSAKSSSFKLSRFKKDEETGLAATRSVLIDHIRRSLSGIHSGQFPPKPPRGGCPNYCPAVAWCWRYQSGW